MRLQDGPRQVVCIFGERTGITRKISRKASQERDTEYVRKSAFWRRSAKHGKDCAIRDVRAFPVLLPFAELRIGCVELRILEDVPSVEVHTINNADLVAILEVFADAWQ